MFRFMPITLCICLSGSCLAQNAAKFSALPNGVEVRAGSTILRITALKENVLRVREAAAGVLPEDASWAVLPEARAAKVAVQPVPDGFSTSALKVSVDADLRVTVSDLTGHVLQQDAAPVSWDGKSFRVRKVKTGADHYFGLGDKTGPLDRAGENFVMWNTDSFGFQESTDPIYKSVPFFIEMRGGRALGVLFDNTFRTFFDFGHERADVFSYTAPDGPLDYYLLYGPDPKAVVTSYAWLTGPTPLPPLWTLGFQQSRYSYYPQQQVEEIATRLRADRIPADAIYLDIDYQDKNRPFTVDAARFPDFSGMVSRLAAEHFHTIAITDLHVADLPNQGYAPYDTGAAGDHFVKNPDGSTYVGPVWPGPAVFPDFTTASARDWWGSLYAPFVKEGLAGFWNDMNEPAVFRYPSKTMPDDVVHRIEEPGFAPRTMKHLEAHNIFGMENSRATRDGLLKLQPDQRPFVLTRASYAGGQRFAATWTGDNSSTWNHLRLASWQLVNLGLSGFAMSGADVGGFAGSPSPELLTKWLEVSAFYPIDRDHAAKGTRPHEVWADGPEQEAIRRRFIEERYRLLPYLYTTAEEMSRDGLPIMRPLFLEFPHATADGHPLDNDAAGEFLFGPSILVALAPSPDEVAPYEIKLPPGTWYDYWTGEHFERRAAMLGNDNEIREHAVPEKPIMRTPKLDDLPVYVRGGSVIPMQPLVQSTEETPKGPLTLRVFIDTAGSVDSVESASHAGTACQGDVYADDGRSFQFRQGAYLREHFSCRLGADGSLIMTVGKHEGSYKAWWTTLRFEIYGWTGKENASTIAKRRVPIEHAGLASVIEVADDPAGTEVVLR